MDFVERPDFTRMGQRLDPTILQVYADGEFIVQKHSVLENCDFQCRLTIKRLDKKPIRSWRILQDIKNIIVGEEIVAIEIYPKESEVTDTGNLYHLWVFQLGIIVNVKLVSPNCGSNTSHDDNASVARKPKKREGIRRSTGRA